MVFFFIKGYIQCKMFVKCSLSLWPNRVHFPCEVQGEVIAWSTFVPPSRQITTKADQQQAYCCHPCER